MKKQGGFTLIELVVVIVILGILAVTAAPRFLNLQSDARESSLQGLKGAMAGAGSIVYGKAAIEGKETISAGESTENISIVFGYPTATSAGIVAAVQGLQDDNEWVFADNATTTDPTDVNGLVATFAGTASSASAIEATGCYVQYNEAANDTSTPIIDVVDTNC
ncbi:type II secretion system protein [Vibrio breoganii]|uniref:MSHA biogenesis protein MshA n=1 Tax=Vibrio breoganii TaxID=553239 RepID=A0AAP8MTK9_9VIBR|nr:type II secretion system protein [Vibrio breoganii]OED88455.1 MSHA biogenesis protein MshA [Vibrio breoganii ZF-55]PMF70286.1 MSHA biogenesis protein MshA [Vibrio breoganii]PMG95470.1 MSHA biogenesis protein MshA [Vibrio breoganii]PMH17834.1 MSHA biogenesis protein MshA [Vibrio breoganii]PML35624.1 MSHA biogenesis protein MshA [Vibrio breoganii]